MSILLSSTRIKGVQFDFYPDCVEIRYSLCIKNVLGQILFQESINSGLHSEYIKRDTDYATYLVSSKNNWYLTVRHYYYFGNAMPNLLVQARLLRENLEKYRNELYVRFEDKIKQRLFEEFSKHREIPSNEEPYDYNGIIDELPY